MKSIAIMQPVYLPWLGYFEQMALCDEFMFLDDVQYTRHDWRNRNKIRTKEGWMWLTVPVAQGGLELSLKDVRINVSGREVIKQLRAIEFNYFQTPYFGEIYPLLESALSKPPARLIDLTVPLITAFAERLKIETPLSFASEIPKKSDGKQQRVIELCRARSAQVFYVGPAAKAYIDSDYFKRESLQVVYQDYRHPVYEQRFAGFESHMSIIDLLMNHGPRSREILLSSPPPPALRKSASHHA